MNKNLLIGLGVFIAIVLVGIYFVRGSKLNYGTPSQTVTTTTTPSAKAAQEVTVSVKEFTYTPSTISLKKGESAKIALVNNGTTAHNLTIEGLNLATKTINPGESDDISFTPSAAGTYTFFCSVDSHRDLGLTGTLTIQ